MAEVDVLAHHADELELIVAGHSLEDELVGADLLHEHHRLIALDGADHV